MDEKLFRSAPARHPGRWVGISFILHLAVGLLIIQYGAKLQFKAPVIIDLTVDTVSSPVAPAPESPASSARQVQPVVPVKPAPAPARQTSPVPQAAMPVPAAAAPLPVAAAPLAGDRQTQPAQAPVRRLSSAAPAATMGESGGTAGVAEKITVGPSGGATGAVDREKRRQRYLKEHFTYIRDMVMQRLVYPLQARRMGWGGRVTVSFVVSEDGSARNIAVRESSGYQILDNCAMDTVRKVAPFPKPPAPAEITIPVQFRLR